MRLELRVDCLLEVYSAAAFVTPFNIGSAVRRPARRGSRTLVAVDRWRCTGWRDEALGADRVRGASHKPAELVIQHDMPDALTFAVAATCLDETWPTR